MVALLKHCDDTLHMLHVLPSDPQSERPWAPVQDGTQTEMDIGSEFAAAEDEEEEVT